ncbi:MAG TPA: septum formation initiator family protein [Blastocatellia bacterium]|nr:septum formation initiator family protein [Blastocatellia bacterium]
MHRSIDGLVIMIILAASAICVSVYYRTQSELAAAVAKHEATINRVDQLRIETEKLESEVKGLKSDPRLIESFARQDLGLVRAGEVVIKIDQTRKSTASRSGEREPSNLTSRNNSSYTAISN